jgi:hypothetical protein
MADFLDEKRREIEARLKELRPLVEEHNRLEKAAAALAGVGNGGTRQARGPARGARRRGRGRPRGTGKRAQQALELVRARPGITIPELAEAMEIKQNYLYRVMPDLSEQGLVTKSGRGWHVRQ